MTLTGRASLNLINIVSHGFLQIKIMCLKNLATDLHG